MSLSQDEFYAMLDELAAYFSDNLKSNIGCEKILDALLLILSDKENIEWKWHILDIDIQKEQALKLLEEFDFNTLNQTIVLENSLFPESFFLEKKVRIKVNNSIWVIHKNDSDPFPSNPHAHNLEMNIKLDLSNGKCYRKKEYTHTISEKTLLQIREKAAMCFKGNMPELSI